MKALQLVAMLLAALLLGTTFVPVLEMPYQLAMPGNVWSTLQQTLYRPLAVVGGPLEVCTIVIVLAVLAAALSRPRLLFLTAGACLSLVLAFAIWVVLGEPAQTRVLSWSASALPGDWNAWRDQWALSELLRFLLQLTGLLLLGASLLNLPIDELNENNVGSRLTRRELPGGRFRPM